MEYVRPRYVSKQSISKGMGLHPCMVIVRVKRDGSHVQVYVQAVLEHRRLVMGHCQRAREE